MRLILTIAAGCAIPWMDRYQEERAPGGQDQEESEESAPEEPEDACPGEEVSIGSLVDTNGVSAPYMEITGEGGSVCSATCDEAWFEVWIASDPGCSSVVSLTATVPPSGLYACYGFTSAPDVEPWSAVCRFEVSGAGSVPRSVVW